MAKSKLSITASDISKKWNTRMKQSIPDIQRGINAITEHPGVKAAAAQDKMLANLTQSVQSGRWAKAVSAGSLSDWKTKTSQKVAERLSGGVDAAMGKRNAFDNWLVSTLNEVLPAVANMPNLTFEDSIARSAAYMRAMHERKYTK